MNEDHNFENKKILKKIIRKSEIRKNRKIILKIIINSKKRSYRRSCITMLETMVNPVKDVVATIVLGKITT